MRFIKIPFKILAVFAVIALTIIILFMKLISHVSAFAFVVFALLVGLGGICGAIMGDWQSLIIAGAFILGAYLIVFLLVGLQILVEDGRRVLGDFILPRRKISHR